FSHLPVALSSHMTATLPSLSRMPAIRGLSSTLGAHHWVSPGRPTVSTLPERVLILDTSTWSRFSLFFQKLRDTKISSESCFHVAVQNCVWASVIFAFCPRSMPQSSG